MGRHLHEKYTKSELNQIIFTDFTKPNTKFLLIAKGVEDYIFTKIFKRNEIKIFEDYINIRTKYSSASKPIKDIILIEQLNSISGF
jgi:hypothetical protein